eukprot:gene8433-10355_t
MSDPLGALVNPFKNREETSIPKWDEIYKDIKLPFHLDLGCGKGEMLLQRSYTEIGQSMNMLGIDIRDTRVEVAMNKVAFSFDHPPTNLYYLCSNVNVNIGKIGESLPPDSIKEVTIFFPDPWVKKKHIKRRMVNSSLINELSKITPINSKIYIMSDVKEIFDGMQSMFKLSPYYNEMSVEEQNQYWSTIPETKYQKLLSPPVLYKSIFNRVGQNNDAITPIIDFKSNTKLFKQFLPSSDNNNNNNNNNKKESELNNELGCTSATFLNQFKLLSADKNVKVGHAGTLDNDAQGVLVVGLGSSCKELSKLLNARKTYSCLGFFGMETTTGDIRGDILNTKSYDDVTLERIRETMKKPNFIGSISQTPPIFSALKYQGKTLSEWAMRGKTVQPTPRIVNIYDSYCQSYGNGIGFFKMDVSSGFYVRSYISDIAKDLNTLGYSGLITRESVGPLSIDNALKLGDITPESLARNWKQSNDLIRNFNFIENQPSLRINSHTVLD